MKSAKCVGSTDVTGVSDPFSTSYPVDHQIVRYAQLQGNATSPRGSMKAHHKMTEQRALGGTNNLLRAMFGDEDPSKPRKMCKVVTREIDTHVWQNGVMVRTETRPEVSHTELIVVAEIPTGTILRRAERLDIGALAYCNMIGYVPSEAQFAELVEIG